MWWFVTLIVTVVLLALEGIFWLVVTAASIAVKAGDAIGAAASVKEGTLCCPRGHAIPLCNGTYECAACKFTYEGSILKCGNPECGATTPYINCPECGLSVRNPYRWGRP